MCTCIRSSKIMKQVPLVLSLVLKILHLVPVLLNSGSQNPAPGSLTTESGSQNPAPGFLTTESAWFSKSCPWFPYN